MKSLDKELKVFISSQESSCDECGQELGSRAWITLAGNKNNLCLPCADLDHLLFLLLATWPWPDVSANIRSFLQLCWNGVVLESAMNAIWTAGTAGWSVGTGESGREVSGRYN